MQNTATAEHLQQATEGEKFTAKVVSNKSREYTVAKFEIKRAAGWHGPLTIHVLPSRILIVRD